MALTLNTNIKNTVDTYLVDAKAVKGGYVVVSGEGKDIKENLPETTVVVGTLVYDAKQNKSYRYLGTEKGWEEVIDAGGSTVEKSEINGNIKVDGQEVTVYTLPSDVVKDSEYEEHKATWDSKQDKIEDLDTIRSGASLGATAVQPSDLEEYVKNTDSRLSDARPASDVYAWAKEENKPSYTYNEVGAAPEEHKHDNLYAAKEHSHPEYLTEESDPIFTASPAAGIKQEDIDKWNTGMTRVSWDDVQGKPETFTPSEHTHDQYLQESDLDGYATEQWVEGKGYLTEHQDISGKADKADTYTKTETETKISEHHDSTKQDKITTENKLDYSLIGGTKPAFVEANPGESATADLTTLKVDGVIYDIKGSGSSSAITYTLIPDESRNITVDIKDCSAYTLTTTKPIEKLTINLPTREEIKFGFISEVNFRNVIIKGDGYNEDRLPSSCILINAPDTLSIKYIQYGIVTDQCLISLHSVINLLFYFDGINLLCYVNETVG